MSALCHKQTSSPLFNQLVGAMKFFKADKGRNPKSHEEFMKEIIKENGIKLPELPEGSKYLYDPAKGDLFVIQPDSK